MSFVRLGGKDEAEGRSQAAGQPFPQAPALVPRAQLDLRRSLTMHARAAATVGVAVSATALAFGLRGYGVALAAAAPLGLLAGCATALLLRWRSQTVYISEDVRGLLGFSPVAVLPARGEVSRWVLDEYVLRLAMAIEAAYRRQQAQVFCFTAVSPLTSVTALVDVLERQLTELGLTVMQVPVATLLEHGETAEKADARGGWLARALAGRRRSGEVVLVVAEPLLRSVWAEYVARCGDATVLVAECGITRKQELLKAVTLLERLEATGVGTVLEQLQLRFADEAFRTAIRLAEARGPLQVSGDMRRAPEAEARPAEVAATPASLPPASQGGTPMGNLAHGALRAERVDVDRTRSEPEAAAREMYAAGAEVSATPRPVAVMPAPTENVAVISVASEAAQANVPVEVVSEATDVAEVSGDVWPAKPAHSGVPSVVKAFEKELLAARGTSVFLRPRRPGDPVIERLEPLGRPAALDTSAEMLAASFGSTPIEIEPEPAEVIYPKGMSPAEIEAAKEEKARRAEQWRSRLRGNPNLRVEPLETDNIRRLLTPVPTETKIATRSGKDMIGSQAAERAARETQLRGWTADGDAGMSQKKTWFQKLFQRGPEESASIIPDAEAGAGDESAAYGLAGDEALTLRAEDSGFRPAIAERNGAPTAVAEPVYESQVDVSEPKDRENETFGGFTPVARVVSLLTPVETASATPQLEPVKVLPPTAELPQVQVTEAARVPAPAAAARAPRRPKSFLELSQSRRAAEIEALMASEASAPSHGAPVADSGLAAAELPHEPHESVTKMPEPEPVAFPQASETQETESAAAADSAVVEQAPEPVEAELQTHIESQPEPQVETQPEPERFSAMRQWRDQVVDTLSASRAEGVLRMPSSASRPETPAWSAATAGEAGRQPMAAPDEEPRLQTRPMERHLGEAVLSRRWGLLSRYDHPDEHPGSPVEAGSAEAGRARL